MSIRNLDAIFCPNAVALIGASNRPNSVGLVTMQNLLNGGFGGPIFPVNPKHAEVAGVKAYPDVASLPVTPDLAVICTPARTVPGLVADLAARGTKGAIVVTAGFQEGGNTEGRQLQQAMMDAARPQLMRIVGPNCLGVLSTPMGLNASFAPGNPKKGGVAFVAQSGAMVTTVLDWAGARGIGFSHLVSLGDMSDVDFGDMLDYLANDPATTAILLYIEAVTHARKFMSAARAASRVKPVIAIKAGRHEAAAKAAVSHTGALAGMDGVYDAAFRRAGILRVHDLDEVFDAVETLAMAPVFAGDSLVILTNGGGAGVLATDALIDLDGRLADLSPQTISKLDAVLPPTWSHGNPVDIIGDASGQRYADALAALLDDPETNAVLVLNCPTAVASGTDAANAVIAVAHAKRQSVLVNWLGSKNAHAVGDLFAAAGIPSYETPDEAIRGFMHLVRYRRGQETILEVPATLATDFAPRDAEALSIIETALAAGRTWLDTDAVHRLLQFYRIPVARSATVATPAEAAAAAKEFGARIALKISSPDITHKSDIGGVVLNLDSAAVQAAAEAMQASIGKAVPAARLQGFVVEEMIVRPEAYELILGMAVDRQFGPFILFGHGGTAVEVINDKALALPPLNLRLARELISQTRISHLLQGYRDRPPAALDEIAQTLVRLSQLVCDLDAVVELDINPLLADDKGVIAVDARVRIEPPTGTVRAGDRLSIRPYPKELERVEQIRDVGEALLRPIRPEDAQGLANLVAALTPEDARLRFFTPLRSLEPKALARLSQIDYDREMAFVLVSLTDPTELLAAVRLAADPDNREAEFAITVRSSLHRRGIGRLLMNRLIAYARLRGLEAIFGDIFAENIAMLALCRQLGFTLSACPGSPSLQRALLRL